MKIKNMYIFFCLIYFFNLNFYKFCVTQNLENCFLAPLADETFNTLNRTVLLSGLHSPTVTISPILTSLYKIILKIIELIVFIYNILSKNEFKFLNLHQYALKINFTQ